MLLSTLEDARNIATVVGASLALVGIVPLFRNLKTSERNLRSKIYFDTLTLLEGKNDDVRGWRHILEDALQRAKASGRPFDISLEGPDVRQKMDRLARTYDKLGLLTKHGVVPVDFLFDFYSRPIILAWQHLAPMISDVRTRRGQDTHMIKFQILAVGAALDRQRKYGEPPPFPISKETRAMWHRWRHWFLRWPWQSKHAA